MTAARVLVNALAAYRASNVGGVYDETLSARALGNTPDSEVRTTTATAYELANADRPIPDAGQEARWALISLPGMSSRSEGALASAVLVACAPTRMAMWDRRVKAGLEHPEVRLAVGPGDRYYGRYLEAVVELQDAMTREVDEAIAPRDVDLALWQLGGT